MPCERSQAQRPHTASYNYMKSKRDKFAESSLVVLRGKGKGEW